jgi:hypothetical protein
MRTSLFLAVALGTSACSGPDDAGTSAGSSSGTSGEPVSTGSGSTAGVTTSGEPLSTGGASEAGTSGAVTSTGAGESSDGESSGGESSTGEPFVCPPAALAAGDHTIQVLHAGLKRSALVHIPASADLAARTPLVLNFHGLTSNPEQQVFFSGMNAKADAEGFILVYPAGVQSSWNAGACCGAAIDQNIDDVGFVRALVAQLSATLCIDERRIYATGMSNGGFMSHRLACEAHGLESLRSPRRHRDPPRRRGGDDQGRHQEDRRGAGRRPRAQRPAGHGRPKADRELPVVWAVAKGSLLNKAILVPAALLISASRRGWSRRC